MKFSTLQGPRRKVKALRDTLKREGPRRVLEAAARRVNTPRARSFEICRKLLRGKAGFEIGGPSSIFSRNGLLPIYPLVRSLDNCNFSRDTIWEGTISEGPNFVYDKKRPPGFQYVREAVTLRGIPSVSYDFVASSHTLEHVANPLLALREWKRLLKDQGIMILIVPHKEGTFDHRRPVTQFGHLAEDLDRNVGEDDLTHLPEILQLHDLEKDPPAGSFDEFKERSEKNCSNRCLHHHVFDSRLVILAMDCIGLQMLAVEAVRPCHIVAIGQQVASGESTDNRPFLTDEAEYRRHSPFSSDRFSAGRS